MNCLLFSSIVPIIPMFGALYFLIKYLVTKYNMVFVYKKLELKGSGRIKSIVKRLMISNLILFLVIMASFFALKFESDAFTYLGYGIIVLWAIVYFKFSKLFETEEEDYEYKLAKALQELNKEDMQEANEMNL